MSYQQALSGLGAASSDLDVIGNNIANANTVGFKQGQAQFADMYASSMATAVSNQIGIGTRLSEVQQQFSQGTITTTNQALDVAINGNGFYQLSNNGSTVYSRNGVFHLDNTGKIVNSAGLQLMGYAADSNGVVNSASTVPLSVPTANIAPTATKTITASFNLNSQDAVKDKAAFDPTNGNTYNASTSVDAYDSLGGTQKVSVYFTKSATGSWEAFAGYGDPVTQKSDLGAVTFDTSGNLTSSPKYTFTIPNGADPSGTTTQSLTLDLTGTTQYGATSGLANLHQDGNSTGELTGFTVGTDGMLTGNYSNGQTKSLGQIAIANFNNQNGLQNLGGNVYAQTAASGAAQVAVPGSTNHGVLQGGAVEDSNVDLTSELVSLITAQRNYQANAQTIKTQQAVDQAVINL
ncbi:flagellar hook protein FlgE [Caballeronia sp. LP006]|uniref:flagellar hook protein FlgE n=1 Tax=unclassified Caballeronia TaxID=2646786 RepID=UPI001FD4162B|nr:MULTISPECIES: flagellar hook protein FlgE [unclassified Caballeronia]MDR5772875.1 flagellar hook protein FlgE [Caballeronia sp. LZ002]MDR5803667.1 flagellar hook protein FlgE [Caballeronia sp. LZ001]MDR5829765.1 flagellar hook protein FlgE [Caballeronia sp. LP006]MDR5848309.1 flagellar hook protein FlgE [Caballeronia sp. LZ003]